MKNAWTRWSWPKQNDTLHGTSHSLKENKHITAAFTDPFQFLSAQKFVQDIHSFLPFVMDLPLTMPTSSQLCPMSENCPVLQLFQHLNLKYSIL